MATEETHFDVIIAGGGMVGATLACALSQQGFSIAVIEPRAPDLTFDIERFDIRVSAITRVSQNIFNNIGVWSQIKDRRVTAYDAMHVWDQAEFGEIHFDASDIAEPDLGHIIENNVIQSALWQRMKMLDVTLITPDSISELDLSANNVTTEAGLVFSADLIVAADGGRSRLRDMANISTNTHSYQQSGLVATVTAEKGNQATAWQRFMPNGPLALLPINADKFSIVWTCSQDEAIRLSNLPNDEFNALLTQASETRLGTLTLNSERGVFPLAAQHATVYVKQGFALVGDAAHVIHPLAGQGVNLGLLDVAQLADTLIEARAKGYGLGDLAVLRRYERARRGHNQMMQSAMTAFKVLFSNDVIPLRLLRNVGLAAANRLGPLRHVFERIALKGSDDLPSLAKLRNQ